MSSLPRRWPLAVFAVVALPAIALACLWDYDTLKQERARFTDTLELITGKFLRHSKEFYEWRIQDRLKKLQGDPKNLSCFDDLAVAYDKTGQHDKAIETMLAKEKLQAGLYETYANLGTFYFHSGKLEDGLPYIDMALAINPDAHFGRERYQKWLVEWVKGPRPERNPEGDRIIDFADYVAMRMGQRSAYKFSTADRQSAVKGILGMMRFGQYDSPVLLEALGDLLAGGGHPPPETDAKRLAAFAYLHASRANRGWSSARKKAEQVIQFQTTDPPMPVDSKLEMLEHEFKHLLADAEAWYENLHERELSWIKEGQDPEFEFDRLYIEEPRVTGEIGDPAYHSPEEAAVRRAVTIASICGIALVLAVALCFVFRAKRRRSLSPTAD